MNTRNIDELLKKLTERKLRLDKVLESHGVAPETKEASAAFSTDCESLKDLRVAAIMDGFTLGNFKDECCLCEITCQGWKEQIDSFKPDLFFLESAWGGKDNSWYKKIANGSKELYELTAYCRSKGIPVIFWNKEDPVYTDVFMSAASCADYVFTTDFDCIERYKRTLQHNNVYLLHFSAQPRVHNPMEIHQRKDKFCFAGAYYHRYKERSRVFDAFADVFEKGKGLEIYDRNLGSARPEHAFPQRYSKMIVGTLKPEDIHIAYKGYNFGVNMNSVSSSQTMFARRVYELLGSNTVSVGNYSRGTKNLFGDLTLCTDNAAAMENHLQKYCGTEESYRKYRLAGLRKVYSENLCEHRLGFIADCVFGKDMVTPLPQVVILAAPKNEDEKKRIEVSFRKQSYERKRLVFVDSEDFAPDGDMLVGAMSPEDYYGENYILDLALSRRYSGAEGFGKSYYYENTERGTEKIASKESTYKAAAELFSTRGIFSPSLIKNSASFARGEAVRGDLLAVDEFNYCKNYKGEACPACDDLFIADKGIALHEINAAARSIDYAALDSDILRITPQEMFDMCERVKGVSVKLEGCRFIVTSKLREGKSVYLRFARKFLVDDLFPSGGLSAMFSGSGELITENVCTFFDGAMKETGSKCADGGSILKADIPKGSKFVTLALRISGSGEREYSGITCGGTGSAFSADTPLLSRSDVAVVADHYPTYDDLYRYMFVHKRNLLYKDSGLVPDVLCINMWNENRYTEFEGMNVLWGKADKLAAAIESGRIRTVCVHFLNEYLWSVLKSYLGEINLIIWSHGSDIQPWHRRKFNYKTDEEIKEAKASSEKRESLWREVFASAEAHPIRFVYVSEFFKNQIEEDYGVDLSGKCEIIHNCIDTGLFSYEKKPAEQRFRLMSVKSFSTLTYANDITQSAIELLSREPEFSKMTFDLYGDGDRFDEDTRRIKGFSNVRLHRGFLTQSQIAALHKDCGIYIATTRMDTQGVSRDEAMSSGLVPVASAVAAIPEFVNEDCGILVPGEDPKAVAEGILRLIRDPELFSRLSENAASHVRSLTAKKYTIDRELELILSMEKNK